MRLEEINFDGDKELKRDIISKNLGRQAILNDVCLDWMHVLLTKEYNNDMYTVKEGNTGEPICLYYSSLQKLIILHPSNGNSLPEIN